MPPRTLDGDSWDKQKIQRELGHRSKRGVDGHCERSLGCYPDEAHDEAHDEDQDDEGCCQCVRPKNGEQSTRDGCQNGREPPNR